MLSTPSGLPAFIDSSGSEDGEFYLELPDSVTSEDAECLLPDFDDALITMPEVKEFFAGQFNNKLRTETENKKLKSAALKDRNFFNGRFARLKGSNCNPHHFPFQKNINIADVKARTNCRNCCKKGHWARECTEPKKPNTKPTTNLIQM